MHHQYQSVHAHLLERGHEVANQWREENVRDEYSRLHRGLAIGLALSACFWLPVVYAVWG